MRATINLAPPGDMSRIAQSRGTKLVPSSIRARYGICGRPRTSDRLVVAGPQRLAGFQINKMYLRASYC